MSRVYEDAMHRVEVPEKGDTSDPAEVFEAFESMAANWPAPENFLPKLKEQITEFLVKLGHPAPDAVVAYRGQDFRPALAGEMPKPGEMITLGWKYALQVSEPLTVEHEAANLYGDIFVVEDALEGGDVGLVFAHALKLGAALERFKLRRLHLKSVTTGAKVLKGGRGAAEKTNAAHRHLREARLVRMGQLIPKLGGVDKAAAQCEFEGLGRWETIKRDFNRQMKKRDT